MINWWQGREPREQILLSILGALLALFAGLFVIILPVLDARADAERALSRAQTDYQIVSRALPNGGAISGDRAAFSRAALLDTARAEGLKITRIQADNPDGFAVWIDDAETTRLYGLFDRLSTDTTAQFDRVVINADGVGRLSAQFTVR
jgi:general secretion pathway protein M